MKKILPWFSLIILFYCKKYNKTEYSYISDADFDTAKAMISRNVDSAYIYFNFAKNNFLSKNDSVGAARSLINMAILQEREGDYFGSIETSLEAEKYLKTAVRNEFINNLYSSNYNSLAIASKSLKKYSDAEKYYQHALKVTENEEYKSVINNNIGDVLILKGQPGFAIKYLKKALLHSDSLDYARALNNLAKAKFLSNINYNPVPELEKALKIRTIKKNAFELNSSFATLADYYSNRNQSQSLYYARMMLKTASENRSPDDQIEALEKIIKLEPKNYLNNFLKFQKINDSVQTSRNRAKNQFAVIRYDLEQKNTENQALKFEKLKDENKIIILLGTLIILVLVIFFLRKRQIRLKQEKELEVKNTQLKMSKKVHDVVANGIYQVMTRIENQEDFNRDQALDRLEAVYEKSRDISYEKAGAEGEEYDFSEGISELIGSFKNEQTETYIAGNEQSLWAGMSAKVHQEVYRVILELLVNMKKHSRADRVVFRFEREKSLVRIFYTDNGHGISGAFIHGNGLSSTVSRIENIGGKIIFDTGTEKGLKVNISFPVS